MLRRRMMAKTQEVEEEMKEEKIVDITLEEESKELLTSLTQDMYEKIVNAKEICCVATIEGSAETQTATSTLTMGIFRTGQGWFTSKFIPDNTYGVSQNNTYKTGFQSILFRGSIEEKFLLALCNGLRNQYNYSRIVHNSEVPSSFIQGDTIRMASNGIPMGVGTNLKIYIRR